VSDAPRTAADVPLPGGDFRLFVQKLAYQGLIALGVVDNPLTQERRANLPNARAVVEDLEMLKERTAGNLAPEEAGHLEQVLREVRRHLEALE
jgi:hypothetical protein